jgi:hypothetical protein
MSVWYCIPSKRPVAEANKALQLWRDRGYKIALFVDNFDYYGLRDRSYIANSITTGEYPGYAAAVNRLVRQVLSDYPTCDFVVTGGDDVHPDLNHTADEIAAQCSEHFEEMWSDRLRAGDVPSWAWELNAYHCFGVMQPTGDRWGEEDAYARAKWPDAPAMIDRICGSPWMGRSFCERINQGQGPLWPEYHHNWVDEELQNVAIKYGCFWQRRDLIHYHDHCRRSGGDWAPHLLGADADYKRMEPMFRARQRMGFPGSEPL